MMQKTFFAEDMRQALRLVRDDMGAEAIILANKKVPGGVEVAAAIPGDMSNALRPIKTSSKVTQRVNGNEQDLVKTQVQETSLSSAQAMIEARAQRQIKEMRLMTSATGTDAYAVSHEPIREEYSERRQSAYDYYNTTQKNELSGSVRNESVASNKAPAEELREKITSSRDKEKIDFTSAITGSNDATLRYENELGLVKKQLDELKKQLSQVKNTATTHNAHIIKEVEKKLLTLGFSLAVSERIANEVTEDSSALAWRNALSLLGQKLPCDSDEIYRQFGCYTFIGSPGAGKTSVITKLAIEHIKKYGKDDLILVSLDNQRLGASFQITQLAQLLKVPVFVGEKADRIVQKIEPFSRNKKILIDTAGVSAFDEHWLQQMNVIKRMAEHSHNILVMSCTQQLSVLDQMINDYLLLDVAGVILSKVDEATSLAEVMSVSIENKLPIFAMNNHQRSSVPLLKLKAADVIELLLSKSKRYVAASEFMSFNPLSGTKRNFTASEARDTKENIDGMAEFI